MARKERGLMFDLLIYSVFNPVEFIMQSLGEILEKSSILLKKSVLSQILQLVKHISSKLLSIIFLHIVVPLVLEKISAKAQDIECV
jgi:hypothetical protein